LGVKIFLPVAALILLSGCAAPYTPQMSRVFQDDARAKQQASSAPELSDAVHKINVADCPTDFRYYWRRYLKACNDWSSHSDTSSVSDAMTQNFAELKKIDSIYRDAAK
jgi:hypothetical protein